MGEGFWCLRERLEFNLLSCLSSPSAEVIRPYLTFFFSLSTHKNVYGSLRELAELLKQSLITVTQFKMKWVWARNVRSSVKQWTRVTSGWHGGNS